MEVTAIALLINENAIDDLKIFLYTLELWNSKLPTLYIYCTTECKSIIQGLGYAGQLEYNTGLDAYANLSRSQMERMPSKEGLSNRFHDFTVEKCSLMEWALTLLGDIDQGVLFCDADICWLGPLPTIPRGVSVALSPHEIRESDEQKFGIYNAGFLWMNDLAVVESWRKASSTSRFFEQLALNTVAEQFHMYRFGTHINYGWWRMFQGRESIDKSKAHWTIKPSDIHSGLLVKGEPVICVHTHWKTTDHVTNMFNTWIVGNLKSIKENVKVRALVLKLT
jgi:hypothetical protein